GTSSAVTTPAVGTNDWLNIGNTIYGDLSTGRVALGAAAVTAGAIFDLSSATGTAKSSMILPKDTTTNRPTAGVEGMVRYNTTDHIIEVYQGSTPTWVQLAAAGTGAASSTLGTAAGTPSPYRDGEATTGLYSSAAGQVQVGIAGTERLRVTATGMHVVGNINLAAITNYYSIGGSKILHQPASDTTSIGVGADTLAVQTATNLANTALGYHAGSHITSGNANLALGPNVGSVTLSTGSSNILIGTSSAVDTPAADTSNFLNIGNVINANISSQLVGINRGTTLAIHPFQVGTSSSNGNGAYLTSAGVWTSISDARVKENVKPLAYGIDDLMKLRPVSYDMKGTHEKQIGLIAQEVMKVVPEVVSGSEETRYGLSYDTLLALAIKSIQELKVANDNQAKTVAQLSEENVQLRAKIQDLHDHASGAKVTMDDHDLIMMVIKVGGALFVLMLTGVGLCGYGLWRAARRKAA
ncbi:MAG: tail fiber domain-containing protein, partial [Alphaproteobacteria bacterium]|nr:tail fiber domain-containing protein [Alphaproteobacteria bacterium]